MVGGYIVVEAIFVITLVIAASSFSSTITTLLQDIQESEKQRLNRVRETLLNDIEIIFATASVENGSVTLWVKNVGDIKITRGNLYLANIFLIGSSGYVHISHGGGPPSWRFNIVRDINGDGAWDRGETIQVTIELGSPLQAGEYMVRMVLGRTRAEHIFSVG